MTWKEELKKYAGEGVKFGVTVGIALVVVAFTLHFLTPKPTAQDINMVVEQRIDNNYEKKTVCSEWDWDYVKAYPESNWERLEKIPDTGVIQKNDLRSVNGGIWITIDRDKANVSAPDKVTYKSVKNCVNHTTKLVKKNP